MWFKSLSSPIHLSKTASAQLIHFTLQLVFLQQYCLTSLMCHWLRDRGINWIKKKEKKKRFQDKLECYTPKDSECRTLFYYFPNTECWKDSKIDREMEKERRNRWKSGLINNLYNVVMLQKSTFSFQSFRLN